VPVSRKYVAVEERNRGLPFPNTGLAGLSQLAAHREQ
jgi:hypothetical protein